MIDYAKTQLLKSLFACRWERVETYVPGVPCCEEIWLISSLQPNRGYRLYLHFGWYWTHIEGEDPRWEVSAARLRYDEQRAQECEWEHELAMMPVQGGQGRIVGHLRRFLEQLDMLRCGENNNRARHPQTIGGLFIQRPDKWGTRGNAFLWADLQSELPRTALPATWDDVKKTIARVLYKLTGHDIDDGFIECKRYEYGGLCQEVISTTFWHMELLPLLQERYENAVGG